MDFLKKISPNNSSVDLIDTHKQLRHEATALRLQLKTKQEVLERTAGTCDDLYAQVRELKISVEGLERRNEELHALLKRSKEREAMLRRELDMALRGQASRDGMEASSTAELVQDKKPGERENEAMPVGGAQTSPKEDNLVDDDVDKVASNSEDIDREMKTPLDKKDGLSDALVTGNSSRKACGKLSKERLKLFELSGDDSPILGTPGPLSARSAELASACKITMAARVSDQPKDSPKALNPDENFNMSGAQ